MKNKQAYNKAQCYSPARITHDGLIEVSLCKSDSKTETQVFSKAREEDSILSNVPLETNFFYNILKFIDGRLEFGEKGIGELQKSDGRTILVREYVFTQYTHEMKQDFRIRSGAVEPLPYDGWYNLTTHTPPHYSQLLVSEHSVPCSIDRFTPSTVPLEEGTLLGRLDGRIQSIDADELRFILGDNIKGALEESEGNLHLRVKEIDLKARNSIIMTNQIQLKPQKQRPRRFSVGSLYYNEKKKTFEFHDGEKWRTLVTE